MTLTDRRVNECTCAKTTTPTHGASLNGSLAGALCVLGRSNEFVNETVNTMPRVTATQLGNAISCGERK